MGILTKTQGGTMKYKFLWISLLIVAMLLAGCQDAVETTAPTEPVQYAPDFTVYNEKGEPVKLSDFRGKPVVLNFWASWCPPCKAEMPDFEKKYKELGDKVQFLMVNITSGDDFETAKDYIAQQGYQFPVFYDTTGEAAYLYGVQSIPVTYFIGADGQMVAYIPQMATAKHLQTGIDMILGQ
jgi:peroxiredoxin